MISPANGESGIAVITGGAWQVPGRSRTPAACLVPTRVAMSVISRLGEYGASEVAQDHTYGCIVKALNKLVSQCRRSSTSGVPGLNWLERLRKETTVQLTAAGSDSSQLSVPLD